MTLEMVWFPVVTGKLWPGVAVARITMMTFTSAHHDDLLDGDDLGSRACEQVTPHRGTLFSLLWGLVTRWSCTCACIWLHQFTLATCPLTCLLSPVPACIHLPVTT